MPSVRFMSMLASVGALALLGTTPSAFAAVTTYTVGGEKPPLCDFGTIQAAVAAAAAAGGGKASNIHVAMDAAYTAEAIVIDNLNLNIIGGFAHCSDAISPNAHTTISGAGNAGHSVIAISGTSNVTLQNLTISGAGAGGAFGGGIDFAGNGTLTLAESTVSNNNADFGGGIHVAGSGGSATLALNDNVLIQDNTALDAGGIYLQGTAHLLMSGSGTQVSSNHAVASTPDDGLGGGILVLGPAQADIGAPGIGSHGAIYNNTAEHGAGIFVRGEAAATAKVTLFTTDPAHPVFLDSNQATSGGALYLDATTGPAVACLFDARISGNSAIYSAVYSDHGQLYMNTNPGGVCDSAAMAAAVRCTPGPGCNEISGNMDTFPRGIIFLDNGILEADRIIFRGLNISAYAIQTNSAPSRVSNCLISGNHFKYGLISNYGGSDFIFDGCTTADNTVDSGFLFESESGDSSNPNHFVLTNSVIYESAGYKTFIDLFADGDGILLANYDLLRDTSTVSQGGRYFSVDPQFVDPASGDYHLQPISPAVDFAPAAGGFDLDGNPRDVVVYDDVTRRDIGAYEYQIGVPDRVFADGFERL